MKHSVWALVGCAVVLGACQCDQGDIAVAGDSRGPEPSDMRPVVDIESVPQPGTPEDFAHFTDTRVYYDFDKYHLEPEAEKVLAEQAAWLLRYPERRAIVAGYCDVRGTLAYNDKLGQRRADAVRDRLIAHGVAPERLATISYGSRVTLVAGTDEIQYAMNRTAVTVVE